MKKMTRVDFNKLDIVEKWEAFNSLQSELEALEGRNGFVVDWSKAPEWAKGIRITWDDGTPWDGNGETCFPKVGTVMSTEKYIYRPIPPKVAREGTNVEMLTALVKHYQGKGVDETITLSGTALELARGKSLGEICRSAGISLTSE